MDKAYIQADAALRPFYEYPVQLEEIQRVIDHKNIKIEQRHRLVQALKQQYEQIPATPATQAHIQSLEEPTTFTITTAHQPCLLTGPLYFMYKIVDTIQLARQLAQHYPAYRFVPVYWMGGEDHDFEEVNHLHLFGKTWTWEDAQGGAIADYRTDSLLPLLEELQAALGDSEEAQFLKALISNSFLPNIDYGMATLRLVNALFGDKGLVVVDSRAAALKAAMIPIFREEILHSPSERNVQASNAAMEAQGLAPQAHARSINLFYLSPNSRQRIVKEENTYSVLNTTITFSERELLEELEAHPERFSPNVILRPLFQETVLPNLVYVGGGGELAYWLQLKGNFAHFQTPFPMLVRRSSALWIDAPSAKRWQQWGFDWDLSLFDGADAAIKRWLAATEGEVSLSAELADFNAVFDRIVAVTESQDPTLVGQVQAQRQALAQWADKLEKRIVKTQKQRQETSLQQIQRWFEKLFPAGLQERHDNFMGLYLRHGAAFLDALFANCAPLDKNFYIFVETTA